MITFVSIGSSPTKIDGQQHEDQPCKEVSYLGFRLTPEGITPGKDKLKAVEEAKIPETKEEIKSFVGRCNIFRKHV